MADAKVMDVTKLSQIVACDKGYYEEHHTDEAYGSYTAFLVNTGNVEGEEIPTTEMFYGGRRVTNLSIINGDLPNESPDGAQEGRFYLTTKLNETTGKLIATNLYVYVGGSFVPLLGANTFKNVQYDAVNGVLGLQMGDDSQVQLIAYIDGEVPAAIKDSISEAVIASLKESSDIKMTWGSF